MPEYIDRIETCEDRWIFLYLKSGRRPFFRFADKEARDKAYQRLQEFIGIPILIT